MPQPDFQPTLTGDSVVIRPIAPGDWPELFAAASDPEIWKLHPASTRYTEPVFREYFDNAIASHMAFVFVERASGALIGSSRYHGYDAEKSEVEIGWTFIVRDHWGGATNREVKRLMLDHAFTFVDTVIFWVGETNWRSQRAVEKIGGVKREGTFVRGATGSAPHVVFELTKARYREGGGLV
ncbi:MAG: GNAT family N-acetyltransferase [Xanthobacteraceae bacterium]|nr:GNAT family N-acetyltransferase [Xanthobacteraceae bacterium]